MSGTELVKFSPSQNWYISEEKIIRTFHLIPYEVVGSEGFFGICYSIPVIAILSNVHCSLGKNSCVTYKGFTSFESPT